jgi:hypothetical protein
MRIIYEVETGYHSIVYISRVFESTGLQMNMQGCTSCLYVIWMSEQQF